MKKKRKEERVHKFEIELTDKELTDLFNAVGSYYDDDVYLESIGFDLEKTIGDPAEISDLENCLIVQMALRMAGDLNEWPSVKVGTPVPTGPMTKREEKAVKNLIKEFGCPMKKGGK